MLFSSRLSSDEVDLFAAMCRCRFAFIFFHLKKSKPKKQQQQKNTVLGFLSDIFLMHRMMKYGFQVALTVAVLLCLALLNDKKRKTITLVEQFGKKKANWIMSYEAMFPASQV